MITIINEIIIIYIPIYVKIIKYYPKKKTKEIKFSQNLLLW